MKRKSLYEKKWLFQCGLSEDQHIWTMSDSHSQTYSWLCWISGSCQHPGRSPFLPQFWEGNTFMFGKSLSLKPRNISKVHIISFPKNQVSDSKKQVLPTSFSSVSCKQAPTYTAPAAASGWSCRKFQVNCSAVL